VSRPDEGPGRPDERRRLSLILRGGLAAAAAVQVFWGAGPTRSLALTEEEQRGRQLYTAGCASCHGVGGVGTAQGPPLVGVGAAAVDFMLSTGRMPLADPGEQPVRQDPAFAPDEIVAIVAYVTSLGPGGEPIPDVDPSAGSLPEGRKAFAQNCMACHGAGAEGDSVGGGQIAPALGESTARQIAEAIRIGPGPMPRFGPEALDQHAVDSVARYLEFLREERDPGGLGLGRVGPVTEGFVAVVVGLGILLVVIRLTGTRE
jgi:ubiquinol-cytochrome c reductase cytochrome c subunit